MEVEPPTATGPAQEKPAEVPVQPAAAKPAATVEENRETPLGTSGKPEEGAPTGAPDEPGIPHDETMGGTNEGAEKKGQADGRKSGRIRPAQRTLHHGGRRQQAEHGGTLGGL